MITIFIQSGAEGGHNVKLSSDDPVAFMTCIECLKLGIASTNRTYNPATKTWHIDRFACKALQAWLNNCRQDWCAQVQSLNADDGEQPEEAWTPPPPRQQPRQPKLADAYAALFLLPQAPPEVVKAAYRALSLKHHPDRQGDVVEMQKLNAAYQFLSKQVAA